MRAADLIPIPKELICEFGHMLTPWGWECISDVIPVREMVVAALAIYTVIILVSWIDRRIRSDLKEVDFREAAKEL